VGKLGARSGAQAVVFAQLHGAQHGWDLLNTPWTEHTVNAVHCFCDYMHAKYVAGKAREAS
jgi:hypothetical protein